MRRRWIRQLHLLLSGIPLVVLAAAVGGQNKKSQDAPALLEQKCFQCHNQSLKMSGLDLSSRDAILKGGVHGPAVVPGDTDGSILYKRIAGIQKIRMPIPPLPALTAEEITVVKHWINRGAPWKGKKQGTTTGGQRP